jgi:glycosyltransferase involved in cell wall biosynthesis
VGRVSVVIPTAGRPDTLELTLRGVARQLQSALISEVIVSENLGDRRSEAVCALFPELPIVYKFRDPVFGGQMCVFDHVAALFSEASSEFVAFVCDDDVWSPGHLANAVDALDADPRAAAHFSAFYGAESELSLEAEQWGAPLIWLAAGRPERFSRYSLDLPAMLALAWVFTPFQWSTLVARSEAAVLASPLMLESPHPFYADRMLILGLSEQGPLLFDPAVDTLYRVYEGNWQASQDPRYMKSLLRECEALVARRAEIRAVDLVDLWRGYLTDLPAEVSGEVRRWVVDRFTADEIVLFEFGRLLPLGASRASTQRRVLGRLRRAFRALLGKST